MTNIPSFREDIMETKSPGGFTHRDELQPRARIVDKPASAIAAALKRLAEDGETILQCLIIASRPGRDLSLRITTQSSVTVELSMKGFGAGVGFVIPQECMAGVKRATKIMKDTTIDVFDDHIFMQWKNWRIIPAARTSVRFRMLVEEAIAGDFLGTTIASHLVEQDLNEARRASTRGRVRQRGSWLRQFIATRVNAETPCPYCNSRIGDDWQADHIEPVSSGGLSMLSNMVAVCYDCNQAKSDHSLSHFMAKRGFPFEVVIERLQKLNKRVDDIDPDPQLTLF